MTETTARARYEKLKARRYPFLDRARAAAALTVPSILPPEGHSPSASLPQPNQAFGAKAALTLATRVASSLMPPGRSIMALSPRPDFLIEQGEDTVPDDVEVALAKAQQLVDTEIERKNWRQSTNLTSQLLVVTGNALEQILPDNSVKVYRLDQYVVVRDQTGKVLEIVIEENLSPDALTGELSEIYASSNNPDSGPGSENVQLYTHIRLEDGVYQVHQELLDQKVPDSEGEYDEDILPFAPLRWASVPGEDYGRGKVEEHLPDFARLDHLSKAMADGAAMASRNITLVRPGAQGGLNLMRRVTKAKNGDHVVGNPEDVTMLQFTNTPGLQIAQQALVELQQEIGQAFLLSSSTTRNAERVTATEVRMAAQEVDGVVGGVFSTLSKDQSLFRVRRLIYQMQDKGQLPEWPEDIIEPHILTGLEAMGREATVNSIMTAAQLIGQLPPEAQEYPKWEHMLKKLFVSLELPAAIKTDAEVQEDRARKQAMASEGKIAESAGAAASQAAAQAVAQQQQPQ